MRLSLSVLPRPALLALALPLALAACGGSDGPEIVKSCPGLVGLPEAMEQTRFVGGGRDLTDVAFTARLQDVRYGCIYRDDDSRIETEMLFQLMASRGPANPDGQARVGYFVALGEQQPEGPPQIVLREGYQATAQFQGNNTSVMMSDEITLSIPLPAGRRGGDYTIFVGLVLDEEEVEYNRRQQQ